MTEKWIHFNLNSSIKVKLTDLGYQRLADINNSLCGKLTSWTRRSSSYYKDLYVDKDGYIEFQAWDFIRKFGLVTIHGGPEYYEMDILIEIK
jgi:hypothetical protein